MRAGGVKGPRGVVETRPSRNPWMSSRLVSLTMTANLVHAHVMMSSSFIIRGQCSVVDVYAVLEAWSNE